MHDLKINYTQFKRPTTKQDCISYVAKHVAALTLYCKEANGWDTNKAWAWEDFYSMGIEGLLGYEYADASMPKFVRLEANMDQLKQATELTHAFVLNAYTAKKSGDYSPEQQAILDFGANSLFTVILTNMLEGTADTEMLIYRIMSVTLDFNGATEDDEEAFYLNTELSITKRNKSQARELVRSLDHSKVINDQLTIISNILATHSNDVLDYYKQAKNSYGRYGMVPR